MLILEIQDFMMWKGGIFLPQQLLLDDDGGGKQGEGKQCSFVHVVKSQELLDSNSRFHIVSG